MLSTHARLGRLSGCKGLGYIGAYGNNLDLKGKENGNWDTLVVYGVRVRLARKG